MKVAVFEIKGDFGHFKKFYTTSSPLSFSVPPPTAVFGMLGAILGLQKDDYLNKINAKTTKIAIKILNPVRKTRITLNLIDTKNSNSFHLIKGRTQVKAEFLKNPAFGIYVNINDENLFDDLISKISSNKTHYTLSMGLANLIATAKSIGVFEISEITEATEIHTIIPAENVKAVNFENGKKYFREKLPCDMTPEREVLSYKDFIIETSAQSLSGKFTGCYKCNNEIIHLF